MKKERTIFYTNQEGGRLLEVQDVHALYIFEGDASVTGDLELSYHCEHGLTVGPGCKRVATAPQKKQTPQPPPQEESLQEEPKSEGGLLNKIFGGEKKEDE